MATTTSDLQIATAGGAMPAYLARPDGEGPFPCVVVIMEAFGLVPHIREVAERLASEGYVAIAPDFYYRQLPDNKVSYDELPKAIALMQKLDDAEFVKDMEATLDSLAARGDVDAAKIGVTGFCMGGRLAFLSAAALPDRIAAAVPFYGGGIAGHLARADAIRAPLYLFFGEKDAFIPLDQVQQVDDELRRLGKRYELKTYAGAEHGFFCNERASYHAEAAADAWERLLGFFEANLRA